MVIDNAWLADLALRGAAILLLAALVAPRLRVAAWRHLTWAAALAALLLLPLLMGGLPSIPLPVLPAASGGATPAIGISFDAPGALPEAGYRVAAAPSVAPPPPSGAPVRKTSAFSWKPALVVVWGGIALALLAAMLADALRRRRWVGRALPLEAPEWRRDLEELGGGVELYTSADVDVPVTWGLTRQVLLLPVGARRWAASLRRHVLLHELAHVRRRDAAVMGLARLGCALHWFNPLAWWALRRLVSEAELAADDAVLRAGVTPSSYAGDLIGFARGLRRSLPMAAASMARRGSQLEARVRAILEEDRQRPAPRPLRMASALLFAALVVLPAAASLRPERRSAPVAPAAGALSTEAAAVTRPAVAAAVAASPASSPATSAAPGPGPAGRASVAPAASPAPSPAASATPTPVSVARPSVAAVASPAPSPAASAAPAPVSEARASVVPAPALAPSPAPSPAASFGPDTACGESRGASIHAEDDQLHVTVRTKRCKLEIESEGEVNYLADDSGVARMGRGALFEIDERRPGVRRELTVTPGPGGAPSYLYRVDRRERPFDADGQAWLARVLPEIFRATGLNAEARVERILADEGVDGVLREIALIGGDYVARIYLGLLLDQGDLDSGELVAWIELAGRQIGSDYELAEILMRFPAERLSEPGVGVAFVDAAETIGSDYELRRTLARLLDHSTPGPATLDRILAAAGSIGSDYEAAELLIRVASVYPPREELPASYYRVAETIGSDYELRRTLGMAIDRPLGSEDLTRLLRAASSIGSDYELAELLVAVGRSQRLEGEARAAFDAALATVGSSYEHRRVEDALGRHEG